MGYMYTVLWYQHDMNRIMLLLEGIKYNKQIVFISIFMKFATVCGLQTRPTVQSLAADYQNPLHLDTCDEWGIKRGSAESENVLSPMSRRSRWYGFFARSPIRSAFQPKVIAIPACRRLSHRPHPTKEAGRVVMVTQRTVICDAKWRMPSTWTPALSTERYIKHNCTAVDLQHLVGGIYMNYLSRVFKCP